MQYASRVKWKRSLTRKGENYDKVKRNILTILFSFIFTIVCFSPSHAIESLQTQYGSNGLEVDLVRVQKSGKILTIIFSFRAAGEKRATVKIYTEDVFFVDNVESKKYHVLKDEKENFLCSESNLAAFSLDPGEDRIVWYKFPLPPENVTNIQIGLHEVTPFENVVITR